MRAILLGVAVGALVGCGVAPGGRIAAADVPVPPFPECVADEYAYFGETTMAALGVSRPSGRPPPDANRVGMIWSPRMNDQPKGSQEDQSWRACSASSSADGGEISAMTNFPVVDSWQPPGSRENLELAAPVAWQLVLALGVVLLLTASLMAFRQRR